MAAELARVGLAVDALPPYEATNVAQRAALMRAFSASLGVPCEGCHQPGNREGLTPRVRVARAMYESFARPLRTSAGAALFCDGCHQGSVHVFPRDDPYEVGRYMTSVLTEKLAHANGGEVTCITCHGEDLDFALTRTWGARSGPLVVELRDGVVEGAERCDDPAEPCALRSWMRTSVAVAAGAHDYKTLTSAMTHLAKRSPDPDWRWEALALDVAEAAKRGDAQAVTRGCTACHRATRQEWQEGYRRLKYR